MKGPWKSLWGLFLPLVAALLMTPSGCTANGLIGGECADGYEFCDGTCISITDDELNCGRCDLACPRNLACVDALCGGPDGTVTVDGTGGDGGNGMGGEDPGTGGNGFGGINVGAGGPGGNDGSGGAPSTGGNGTGGGPSCVPPYNTAGSCGDCNTSCSGNTPNCAPDGDGGYECVANCLVEPFLTQCGNQCVDPDSDPRHCGSCNNRCESGICAGGSCVGKVNGHMVALCMSFENQSPSQTNLLGNAVFLATGNPVRILAYTRDSAPNSINGTNLALATAAAARGRLYEKTEVTGLNSVSAQLNRTDYDVLIVYDQQNAPAGRMAERAAAWSSTIDTFTGVGGVVIVLGGGGGVDEMHEFIDGIGLVSTTGTINYDDSNYDVASPGDAMAIGVISPFRGVETSCVYENTPMSSGELVYVTEGADPGPGNGDPGVVHRIIVP